MGAFDEKNARRHGTALPGGRKASIECTIPSTFNAEHSICWVRNDP